MYIAVPVRRALALAAAILAAFFVSGDAPAQVRNPAPCGARLSILAQLYLNYRERPVAIGLSSAGNVIEVLSSDDGATWTIVTTGPSGLTCVVQTGEQWQRLERRIPKRGS